MTAFIDIITSVPTVLFTIPLVLAAFYWALAIVGAVDIEIFDGLDGLLDGGVDGALDGALDGAVDGAVDGALDGALDGAMEGAADGAVDGAAEAAEAAEAATQGGVLVLLANVLRLGKVPVTVSLSAFVFWGWITGFLLTWMYRNVLGVGVMPHMAFSITSMVLASVAALGLMNISVRPLEPVFKTAPGRRRKSLVGEACELTTGRVDERFGQARLELGGDDLIIQVRCDHPGNAIGRGDRALIVHFDDRRQAYVVEPLTPRAAVTTRDPAPPAREARAAHHFDKEV